MSFEIIFSHLDSAISAAMKGDKGVRRILAAAGVVAGVGILIVSLSPLAKPEEKGQILDAAFILFGCAGVVFHLAGVRARAKAEIVQAEKIEQVEARARQHPEQPQAAWDLARVKLEGYLNNNLKQVNLIFFVTVTVMFAGFGIIAWGVFKVYESPDNFKASIVVTSAGILVEFIAATFMLIYKSTMAQASSYVTLLEKINAVGMSIQILDATKGENADKLRGELAMTLLSMYGGGLQEKKPPAKKRVKTDAEE